MNQASFDLIFIIMLVVSAMSLIDNAEELYRVVVMLYFVLMSMYFMFVRGRHYINKLNNGDLASMLRNLLLFGGTLGVFFIIGYQQDIYEMNSTKMQMIISMLIVLSCLTVTKYLYRRYWLKRKEKTNTKT